MPSAPTGCLLSRQSQKTESNLRSLFEIRVKLDLTTELLEKVYKDDTPITIFDRLASKFPKKLGNLTRDTRKQLQHHIEFEVNQYIKSIERQVLKHE